MPLSSNPVGYTQPEVLLVLLLLLIVTLGSSDRQYSAHSTNRDSSRTIIVGTTNGWKVKTRGVSASGAPEYIQVQPSETNS